MLAEIPVENWTNNNAPKFIHEQENISEYPLTEFEIDSFHFEQEMADASSLPTIMVLELDQEPFAMDDLKTEEIWIIEDSIEKFKTEPLSCDLQNNTTFNIWPSFDCTDRILIQFNFHVIRNLLKLLTCFMKIVLS